MSVAELHPEHLLDREIHGELDDEGRARLEAHLADCATCRIEREMRADFALELSRESLSPDVGALVEQLAKKSVRPPPPSMRVPRRRARIVALAIAATLTLVVGAFAATPVGRRALAPWVGKSWQSTPYEQAPVPTSPPQQGHGPSSAPSAPLLVPTVAVEPTVTATEAPSPPPPLIAAHPAAPPDGASQLFQSESDARRRGNLAEVLSLHTQLTSRYPASREAQVSRMMVGRMLLDHGDAAGALSAFDAYLRNGGGDLREDALAGRAMALDRLGRSDEAVGAWGQLLDAYPGTAYGAHARARVEAARGN